MKLDWEVMNLKLDPQKTGLGLGSLAAFVHVVWSLFVAIGFAQWWMDWVFSLHFLNNPFTVGPFNIVTALILIAVTGIIGFAIGFCFATIWNYWQKK